MDLKMLVWAARRGLDLAGDFVECGVRTGDAAWAISEAVDISGAGKTFFLFDTPAAHYEDVRRRFAGKPYVKVVRETGAPPAAIAFLHIDVKRAESALEALFDRVSPNAAIILDGYGRAADAYVQSRGLDILGQPTGQGLVVKQP